MSEALKSVQTFTFNDANTALRYLFFCSINYVENRPNIVAFNYKLDALR